MAANKEPPDWSWARYTLPEFVTNKHVEEIYRMHTDPCSSSISRRSMTNIEKIFTVEKESSLPTSSQSETCERFGRNRKIASMTIVPGLPY